MAFRVKSILRNDKVQASMEINWPQKLQIPPVPFWASCGQKPITNHCLWTRSGADGITITYRTGNSGSKSRATITRTTGIQLAWMSVSDAKVL